MEIKTVVIAEKNSVAAEISKIYPKYQVTSVAGHIKKLTFKKFSNAPWVKTKLIDLIEDEMVYVNSEYATKSLNNIKYAKKSGPINLILAMDPDQEGDLIAQHVLKEFPQSILNSVSKVKLESLSAKGIKEAFSKITPLEGNQGFSAELRSKLDLLFGTILTRLISLESFKYSKKWITFNSGRVQSPTLKLVQQRTKEIEKFTPGNYYTIKLNDNPVFGELQLSQKYDKIPTFESELLITHEKSEDYVVPPRTGVNTDELLNLLSREHAVFKKINSSTTNLLSAMYLSGKITYPRTDNNQYSNYSELLIDASKLYEIESKKQAIMPLLKKSSKVTDHSPVTPLVLSNSVDNPLEKKILNTLYNHLSKILSGENIYVKHHFSVCLGEDKTVHFSVLEEIKKSFEDGLTSVKVNLQPSFKVKHQVLSKSTKPPANYNSASLLKQMKKQGIGTKSTRATILEGLLKNEYLKYKSNDLIITNKGHYLCNYWNSRWPQIISPKLTKEIEKLFPLSTENQVFDNYLRYKSILKSLINRDEVQ